MEINFEYKFKDKVDLGTRVRAILGVPEEFLDNETISSPVFLVKASKYVNKHISEVDEDIEIDEDLLGISFIYYICYSLCVGMYARLPKQMENLSTKTILQNIDWDKKAIEMLNACNDIIENALEDVGEEVSLGNTFAVLSDASEYPNTLI